MDVQKKLGQEGGKGISLENSDRPTHVQDSSLSLLFVHTDTKYTKVVKRAHPDISTR